MFNAYFQIAAVGFICLIVLLLLMIKRKCVSVYKIFSLALIFVLSGCMLFFAIRAPKEKESHDAASEEKARCLDEYLAYSYAANGRYDDALRILDSRGTSEVSDDTYLTRARMTALSGDYDNAALLYSKYILYKKNAGEDAGSAETEYNRIYPLTSACNASALSGNAGIAGIKLLSQAEYLQKVSELSNELTKVLSDDATGLDDPDDKKAAKKAAEYTLSIISTYSAFVNNDISFAVMALEDDIRSLNKLMEKNEFVNMSKEARLCLLKGNAIIGDSEAIAENINENALPEELITAIHLFSDGFITGKDLEAVEGYTPSEFKTVLGRLKTISGNKDDLSSSESKELKNLINVFSDEDRRTMQAVVDRLLASTDKSGTLASKSYMEAAKGYNSISLTSGADDCIDDALETYTNSDDADYVEAVSGLVAIITGEMGITNAADYARTAEDLLTPVVMVNMRRSDSAIAAEEAKQKEIEREREKEKNNDSKPDSDHEGFPFGIFQNESSSGSTMPEARGSFMTYSGNSGLKVLTVSTDDESTVPAEAPSFSEYLTDSVSKKKASVSIGQIDTASFPTVNFSVSFDKAADITLDNIKDRIIISDCNETVSEYTVQKVDGHNAKIILICDMSGSMDEALDDLKQGVISFADGMNSNEQVSVIGFNYGIDLNTGFLSDPEAVKDAASNLYASGGTSLYPTIIAAGNSFSSDPLTDNIIICMTDGEDQDQPSATTLKDGLGELVARTNCTIYTIGLGDKINHSYLQDIADIGNGSYLNAGTAKTLYTFYSFIHEQIANRFVISFTAQNTELGKRTLRVEYNDRIGSAEKKYNPFGEDNQDNDPYAGTVGIRGTKGLALTRLSSSYLYCGSNDVELTLYGQEFDAGDTYEITLTSSLRPYTISYTYENANALKVTIPKNMAIGTYGVKLYSTKLRKTVSLSDALTIAAPCKLKHLRFGAYDFSAESLKAEGDKVTLSGNVIMNGWLYFKGDLTVTGNYKETLPASVMITDNKGAYVSYNTASAQGCLTKIFAKKGWQIPVPQMNSFYIYNDAYDPSSYPDFQTDKFTANLLVKDLAEIGVEAGLYPDMIYSEFFYLKPDMPFFEKIFSEARKNIYDIEVTGKLAFTNTQICVSGKGTLKYNKDNDSSKKFQLGKLGLRLNELEADIDTITGDYSFSCEVGLNDIMLSSAKTNTPKLSGLGLKLAWKNHGFDAIELSAKGQVLITTEPVPIYLEKVSLGVSGIAEAGHDNWYDVITNTKITGGFRLATDKITKPKKVLEFFNLKDLYLAEVDDAKINVQLSKFNLNFSAKLKMLGIQLAKADINYGKFEYTNTLMGIDTEEIGVGVLLKAGPELDWKNFTLKLQGTTDLVYGYPYSGLTYEGDLEYDIHWAIFSWDFDVYAAAGVGFFINSQNELQFSASVRYPKNGKYAGFKLDITGSGINKTKY